MKSPLFSSNPVLWKVTDTPQNYAAALEEMQNQVANIIANGSEMVWLLEHPPLYTAGTSANENDLLTKNRFEVHHVGRGGQYTYHGPGQRVAYVMLDLNRRKRDVRALVSSLETWVKLSLAEFNISAHTSEDRVGLWVRRPDKSVGAEDKIAALGIRLKKWVSFHGVSINIDPELEHFSGIVPCGISNFGVTSFSDLGHTTTMAEFDSVLRSKFEQVFGPTTSTLD